MNLLKNKTIGKVENGRILVWDKNLAGKYEGQEVDVWLDKHRQNRTLAQNAYYWGVIIPLISEEWGEEPETVHAYLKKRFLTYRQIIKTPEGQREVELVGSTAKLTTDEFLDFNDKVKMWASQHLNCYIPDPGEI